MSSLTDAEKRLLENILKMSGGYVLDYTDATFAELFKRRNINIHSEKYQTCGASKAKKLQSFWEQEPDAMVAPVLSEMLDAYESLCLVNKEDPNQPILEKCRAIVDRMAEHNTLDSFLPQEFTIPNLCNLPVESQVVGIISTRLEEARKAFEVGANLAVVILCGSVLEGVLLGAAQRHQEKFNRSQCSPKTPNGNVKPFHKWSLSQLIDVAHDVGLLRLDVKKFSHSLREFRNFIHPYQQMELGFAPDRHTAKICLQVLKAALANLAEG
jgi:hypothetical protein